MTTLSASQEVVEVWLVPPQVERVSQVVSEAWVVPRLLIAVSHLQVEVGSGPADRAILIYQAGAEVGARVRQPSLVASHLVVEVGFRPRAGFRVYDCWYVLPRA